MARRQESRRQKRQNSMLAIVVLEVGSLLGIVALAQPEIWQRAMGVGSSQLSPTPAEQQTESSQLVLPPLSLHQR